MWKVEFETLKAQKEIELLIKEKKITREDQEIISAWIRQIKLEGPEGIKATAKWADHALRGEWDGYRSSAFSNRGRIIYCVKEKVVKILIARITEKHDYRK
ncbi:MAG: hypothetical protein ACK5P5_02420 [Pseudobdellovibrionaceae bacterium]|jgi:mRNA-degrading endonuclease YafQ of YafQ-DinJ toxin-antitoxin module